MRRLIITGLKFLFLMTFMTGVLYPGLVTLVADLFFYREAHGSLIQKDGVIIGSELIGQDFNDPKYFWSRPSANNYNPLASGGSNLGPLNPELNKNITIRKQLFIRSVEPGDISVIPPEMVTASASGLDPHISPASALLQVERIAAARGMAETQKQTIIRKINELIEKPQFSLFGESRINVILLNLELDKLK